MPPKKITKSSSVGEKPYNATDAGNIVEDVEDEEEDTIYKTYFQLTDEYYKKYGKRTVVLLQVGSFFEIYGMVHEKEGGYKQYVGSEIEEVAQITNLAIAEKKYTYKTFPIVMSGFRDYFVDKYLQKITERGYTAVVYVQERVGNTKKYIRVFHSVHSPGTFLSCETDATPQQTNNVMCIWLELTKHSSFFSKRAGGGGSGLASHKQLLYGASVANIYTGKSSMFEYSVGQFIMNPTTFDELERFVSTHSPAELIFIHPFTEEHEVNTVLQYIGIQCQTVHKICSVGASVPEKVENCQKQKYVKEILATFFDNGVAGSGTGSAVALKEGGLFEFDNYPLATQSFCYLLNFLQEHNPTLIKKICMPEFNNASKRMILANHTLKQLNIIGDGEMDVAKYAGAGVGNLYSVSSFLNKCLTAMGRRVFHEQITTPTFDIEWLNKEYEMTNFLLGEDKNFYISMFRIKLRQVCDIEKIMRQVVARKIYPASIAKLCKSLDTIYQIAICIIDENVLNDYLYSGSGEEMVDMVERIIGNIKEWIDVDMCGQETSMQTFTSNFICRGKNAELDGLIETHETQKKIFVAIRDYLNKIMQLQEKNSNTEYIKIHETDKGGAILLLTKKRSQILKNYFDGILSKNANATFVVSGETIKIKDVKLSSFNTTNDEINIPVLSTMKRELLEYKDKINEQIRDTFFTFLGELESQYAELEKVVEFVCSLDVLQTKAYIAHTYNYCCPVINCAEGAMSSSYPAEHSFVEAIGLRHCLIEHIQQNELYVANDIYLGNVGDDDATQMGVPYTHQPNNGILLYGTNAVGKTSLIRALGIAVIMAQAGCFVPCSKFTYCPYTAIFSRILGNDNLFKGMSTFAVEMAELRIILKMADENSLILGDELCSGTETESALSIFTAGLMDLSHKKCSFIFATHFHEIVGFSEIQELCKTGGLALKHMSVVYNREKGCLVYDRKLLDGAGTRMYGLEVCKYLQLPDEFLEKAYQIRNHYFPETQGVLSFSTSKKYNSAKIKGLCENCGEKCGEEVHHLLEQQYADKRGFIAGSGVHKNHSANLMVLCESCHKSMHGWDGDIGGGVGVDGGNVEMPSDYDTENYDGDMSDTASIRTNMSKSSSVGGTKKSVRGVMGAVKKKTLDGKYIIVPVEKGNL